MVIMMMIMITIMTIIYLVSDSNVMITKHVITHNITTRLPATPAATSPFCLMIIIIMMITITIMIMIITMN